MPRQLRRELSDFVIRTVQEEGWAGLKNGALLRQASPSFVLLTADQRLRYQQNVSQFDIGVVVVETYDTRLRNLRRFLPEIKAALDGVVAGSILITSLRGCGKCAIVSERELRRRRCLERISRLVAGRACEFRVRPVKKRDVVKCLAGDRFGDMARMISLAAKDDDSWVSGGGSDYRASEPARSPGRISSNATSGRVPAAIDVRRTTRPPRLAQPETSSLMEGRGTEEPPGIAPRGDECASARRSRGRY